MKIRMTTTAIAVACACAVGHAETHAESGLSGVELLDPIAVTATPDLPPSVTPVEPAALSPVRESADALRDLLGVSGSRMGGHGTDLAIRGLSQTRLNILLDGAYVHGGCPNRMDPPTSYAAPGSYEAITVIRGAQTLEYGGGGPGGTVLFERETPRFDAEEPFRGRAEAGYRGNHDAWEALADLAAGNERWFGRFIGAKVDAGNYQDGDGNEVRSGYEQASGTFILGFTPGHGSRLEASFERQQTRDLLFPGAGMDSPKADNDTLRLKFRSAGWGTSIAALRAEIYRSEVEHVMDNYTLRTPLNPMMLMRAPSTSDTTGGRIAVELESGIGRWKIGADFQNNDRQAERINDFNGMLNSVLWPGVEIDQHGVFGELTHPLTEADRLVAGLRYDRVRADASRADVKPDMGLSPNALYAIYYNGAQAQERNEDNVGGLLRLEHDLAGGLGTLYAGLSRSVRTADATERFLASNASSPDGRWVGNPLLEPEKHHQVELGLRVGRGPWGVEASIFYNDVSDYILRDRFHVTGNNATVYRNVDATLIGGEATLAYRWSTAWSGRLGIAYVEATNDTDDRPIAQIPPLEGLASLDYSAAEWDAGARLRAAAKQTRVDTDPSVGSGLDTGETPAWAVLDLYGSYRVDDTFRIDLGIDNVFDRDYAQHLNRANSFDPTQVQVDEPGRSAWLKLSAEF